MISLENASSHTQPLSDHIKFKLPIRRSLRSRLRRITFFFLGLGVLASSVAVFNLWTTHPRVVRDAVSKNFWLSHAASIFLEPNVVGRTIRTYSEAVPIVDLDLGFRAVKTLEHAGSLAIDSGKSALLEHAKVTGYLQKGDQAFRVSLRFKGTDVRTHVQDQKPSFRVVIRDDGAFFGFRRFALMSPKRRGFLHEWVFRRALYREGIIAKRYELIRLRINGQEKGIYVVDEHFDVQLAEYNRRPDSVFVKFSDPWVVSGDDPPLPSDDVKFFETDVTTYGRYQEENYRELLQRATFLLASFRNGESTVAETFDVPLFARYFALADIFNAWHGLSYVNLRFFFNPISGLLEPAPDDNYNELVTGTPSDRFSRLFDSYNTGFLLREFMDDPLFRQHYLEELARLSDSSYLKEFWLDIQPELDSRINILRRDYPLFDFRNVADTGGIVGILQNYGVGIQEIDKKSRELRIRHQSLVDDSERFALSGSKLSTDKTHRCELEHGVYSGDTSLTLDRFLNGYSVLIPKGTLLIEQDVVVPAGCILKLEPGAKVQLNNGARLVSYAPILANGSESDPVVFSTSDPNGRPGGILVMKTTGRSVFDNVIIEGLSVGVKETRFLKGAVTFYKADVDISNSTFSDNFDGDDMLNVIASDFSLRNTKFFNSYADGFDADFATGNISTVELGNIGRTPDSGGDGLDISGSTVQIQDLRISNVADKAISAGENSRVEVKRLSVTGAPNGIVSKDGTHLRLKGAKLSSVLRGLLAIRKKKGYAVATLEARDVSFDNVPTPILLDRGLTLIIDDVDQKANVLRGAQLVYPERLN